MRADKFTQMGLLSLIPGMEYMIERMQEELTRMRQTVEAFASQDPAAPKRRGRPPGPARNSGWSDDPDVRKVEQKRRQAKALKVNHPRDPRHPDHEAWVEMMSRAQKKRWKTMSAAARKKQVAKMTAGQRAARQEIAVNGAA